MKDSFDTTVRVRVPTPLKLRLEAIAKLRVKLMTEVSREAVVEFVEREEARLGIVRKSTNEATGPDVSTKEAHAV